MAVFAHVCGDRDNLIVDNGYHLLRPPQPSEISAVVYEQANKRAGY